MSRPRRNLWATVVAVAVLGALAYALAADHPRRAAGSYLLGLVLVLGSFELGQLNIRLADRFVPDLTMAAALFSYVMTAASLAAVLALSSPRIIDPEAIATGLGVGLVVWLGYMIAATWVRPEQGNHPVNISVQDGSPPDP